MKGRNAYLAIGLLLTLALPAAAQQPERSRDKKDQSEATATQKIFSAVERERISTYFRTHRYAAKPLPPGIARNLARGKPLPPGIAKQRIPADLSRQLVVRSGYESLIVGDKIVLIDPVGIVVDILSDIF